jgi:hypothetical protein
VRKFLRAVLTIFFLLAPFFASASNDAWDYRLPIERSSGFSLSQQTKKMEIGGLSLAAKFCSERDRYICFATEGLSFSVPRDLSPDASSWLYGKHRYEAVLMPVPFKIFGKTIKVYQIDSKTQDPQMSFFYSKEHGLVGAKILSNNEKALLLLEQGCGFGAAADCK